ncbi:alkaline-phosphatase-like protein [Fennellomyces sp. T-0311]|nr:alkaline-phosphatase-like protein [Fennellomyces sp. T-0311]
MQEWPNSIEKVRREFDQVVELRIATLFSFLNTMSDSGYKPVQDPSLPPSASYGSIPVTNDNALRTESPGNKNRIAALVLAVICIILLISAGIGYLLFYPAKSHRRMYHNGTHAFNPTVILISLDGVVNHDLDLHLTPHMSDIANQGVRAHWMTPSFPPITFPNHWSLVTGLYPETHGVVGNYFYDPSLNDSFHYKHPEQSWDAKWWGGEPIWVTAVRQGLRSGVIMWPGCSTIFENDLKPSLTIDFNNEMTFDEKVDQSLEWIDLPFEERPEFISIYMPQVDQAGHKFGPYANQTLQALHRADKTIGRLVNALEERHLTDIVHLMIVSDHGMSATDKSRIIYYDDELSKDELDRIYRIEGDPLLLIRPKNEDEDVEVLYEAFKRLQEKTGHFKLYRREEVPDRLHFRNNVRIPPLIVIPENEWIITTHDGWISRGVHGYDNLDPQSRAIFVGMGPTFVKEHEAGTTLEPFWNVELYSLFTRILGLEPAVNNGTLKGYLQAEKL